ncbi:MAG TPA: hypothetical protein PK760_04155, partial [Flavobacteriales bacterium]|nr:hypothetical protein [Flavobacteriales bacterium]
LLLCGAYRVFEAERVAASYVQRTQWQRDRIAEAHEQGLRKAIVETGNIEFGTSEDRVGLYWSTGVESLLLSAKEGPDRTVSVITTDDLQEPAVISGLDQLVLRRWDVLDPGYLDARWFAPLSGRYQLMRSPTGD